jgi:molybdopterin-guanine dinucleotide biosynthesis protein A
MASARAKTTGVVLAGGRGRRMGGLDKGLMLFHGRPLVAYSIDALKAVADHVLVSANRHVDAYAELGYPVIADADDQFDGPLAGLLSAMQNAKTSYVLSVPCDCPLIRGELLGRLYTTLRAQKAEVCVAHDGERVHPVIMIVQRSLAPSLADYLAAGERKVETWLRRHRLVLADFRDHPEVFVNVNTREDLARLQDCLAQQGSWPE